MKRLAIVFTALIALSSFTLKSNTLNKIENEKAKINFRIQLCQYVTIVPVKKVELLREIGATPVKTPLGSIYVTKPYSSQQDAELDLPKLKALGFDEAQSVVQIGNELMTVENYQESLQNDTNAEEEKPDVIRIWK